MGILSFTEGVISMEAQSLKLRNGKFVVKAINDFLMVHPFNMNFFSFIYKLVYLLPMSTYYRPHFDALQSFCILWFSQMLKLA